MSDDPFSVAVYAPIIGTIEALRAFELPHEADAYIEGFAKRDDFNKKPSPRAVRAEDAPEHILEAALEYADSLEVKAYIKELM
jgi:hypothetical protein